MLHTVRKLLVCLLVLLPVTVSAENTLTAEECMAIYRQGLEACAKNYEYDEAGRKACEQREMNKLAECLKGPMGEAERTFSAAREFFDLHSDSGDSIDLEGGEDSIVVIDLADVDEEVREKCRKESQAYFDKCVEGGESSQICADKAYKVYLRCLGNNK